MTWRTVTILTISGIYWLFLTILDQKRREIALLQKKQESEKRELQLQIAFENARLNPHFIFNTLHYIYLEVEQISPRAEAAVNHLSEMMRYAFAPIAEDGKVPLEDELAIVGRFIEMCGQRLGEDFNLVYRRDTDNGRGGLRIPPHTILLLVENMAKHGILNDRSRAAHLTISCIGKQLKVEASNHKPELSRHRSNGMGMQNLATRLEHYYPGLYQLDIRETTAHYDLTLTIHL